ncbi:hypothetical protein H6P81_002137 [Aristolochia fimbriata]|uniref:Uncharacterized protein n=1 Tax=Aristolochia fimbriata TaxID=158543 RepID=A0AAV7FAP5_ARIFI|nr:hypothetical protein H6P81_002137 [Aristolochia fimbriata]
MAHMIILAVAHKRKRQTPKVARVEGVLPLTRLKGREGASSGQHGQRGQRGQRGRSEVISGASVVVND